MVGMSQEQSALFWQSLTWKFVLRTGLVKESICHTSPSLLQTFGETCRSVGVSASSSHALGNVSQTCDAGRAGAQPYHPALARTRHPHAALAERCPPNAERRTPTRRTPPNAAERRRTPPNAERRRTPNADTPTRRHADTSPLAWRTSFEIFIR
jgi:hypothetical protein